MATLRDYLGEWLETQRARLQPTTWESYRGNVERYLAPALGGVELGALTAAVLERHYAALLARGGHCGRPLSLRTVHYAHAVLHKALADAVRLDFLPANPASRVQLPRLDPLRDGPRELRVWSGAQVRAFLDATRDDPLHDLWQLALVTGLRRGELLALRWTDLDLARRTLTVRHALTVVGGVQRLKPPKTSRIRTLHLDAVTVARLVRRAQPDGFVFGGGQPLDPMSVTRAFRTLVRRLDLPPIRLHDCRHVHASLLLAAGVPVKVVSERLGHATVGLTLDVYAHVLPAMDGEAAERFAALVLQPRSSTEDPG